MRRWPGGLADRIGIPQQTVTYYEVHGVSPPPGLLVKIADALDVTTDELLGREATRKAIPSPDSLRRRRRLKRIEALPSHNQKAVLKMIDALADKASKRKSSQFSLPEALAGVT